MTRGIKINYEGPGAREKSILILKSTSLNS